MNKRGISHIEVVISFVLFIGFLIFGLYFFNPLSNERVLESSLFYATDAIIDNSSSTFVSYSIVIGNEVTASTIALPLLRGPAEGPGVRVETVHGVKLRSNYENEHVIFERSGGDSFVLVKFGNFPFVGASLRPSVLKASNFSISSSDIKEIISEQSLASLKDSYNADYESVREQFNLPRRVDFSFSVVFSENDKINAIREIPSGVDVSSDTKRVEVLRLDGSSSFADLAVRIW